MENLSRELKQKLLSAQKSEITEHLIYGKLAKITKNQHNKEILGKIAGDEKHHHDMFAGFTNEIQKPNMLKVWLYIIISRIFGLTFGLKLMESGEEMAQDNYEQISTAFPEIKPILEDEERHEKEIIDMLDEEKLNYIGSIVLGLNDALVELTGALAGMTLAFQNGRLIAVAGLITGIAASLSMAVSEYLSTHTGKSEQNPLKASLYTGAAYVVTVTLLIFPFFTATNVFFALGWAIINALLVILIFTFYNSVVQETSFKKDFLRMALLSMGVAALTFGIAYILRKFIQIDI